MTELDHVNCSTPDLAEETARKLAALLPECAGENGEIDLDKLRQCLSSKAVEGNVERYRFEWPGKRAAMAAASAATTKTLRPCREESSNFDGTQNLYIEGDNLEALKLLQTGYAGRVKMIYIDPPYNTGHDFVYRDRFSLTQKELDSEAGAFDEDGNRFEVNDSAEARYHSNWCSMMWPRLKLARNLLRDDGVIFISIDDNEVTNLRKLCDEVFGERNFVAQLVWEKKKKGAFLSKSYINMKEYIVVYTKSNADFDGLVGEINREEGNYPCIKTTNAQGIRTIPAGTSSKFREQNYTIASQTKISAGNMELTYLDPLIVENGILKSDVRIDAHWIYGQDKIDEFASNGELYITQDNYIRRVVSGERVKLLKDLLLRVGSDGESLARFKFDENLNNGGWGTNEDANDEIHELFGVQYLFDFSKPSRLITKLVQTVQDPDALILDFFSGSATTAHAVMLLNAEDGGNRKFIMVQLPEVCESESEAAKAGYKNICEIGKERIRRAGKKILDEHPEAAGKLDTGFRVLKLDSSSLVDAGRTVGETKQGELALSRIREDRSPEDLLFQLLLETRIPLSEAIATAKVGGNELFFVGGAGEGAPLVACLDPKAKMDSQFFIDVAKLRPGLAFFRDDAFADDSARTNLQQAFKQFSPTTSVKVI